MNSRLKIRALAAGVIVNAAAALFVTAPDAARADSCGTFTECFPSAGMDCVESVARLCAQHAPSGCTVSEAVCFPPDPSCPTGTQRAFCQYQ